MYYRIISAFLLCLFFQTTWAVTPTQAQFVEKIMQKFMHETQAPGAAVAIVRDGKSEIYVFGNADIRKKIPVTPKTLFEVGSVTKVFTAILLADDVNHHRLQLTDSISQHLPEVEGNWVLRRITLAQLATHTAGFPFQAPETLKTSADLKQYLLQWKPSTSGLTYQYSNPGIGLLGKILEAKNHRDINQLYLERILLPLNMAPIGITVPANLQSTFAQGYYASGKPAPYTDNSLFPATAALKMSIEDLSKFLSASLSAPGTPKELLQAINLSQTPQVQVGNMQQALGWQVRPFKETNSLINDPLASNIKPSTFTLLPREAKKFNPNALIEKTGGANGFRTYIALIPSSQSGVVIVTNRFVDLAPLVTTARMLLLKKVKN